ncbi:putative leucine-rich repeat-containing protein DDB_G0290503 [Anabrus simplex]|uniref:putative leucine-rich repeat-containing protein DDB_G0290503 n=1 Tax=Anabrus simplex TaxID=316456 RepID=UPI0035A28666
MGAAESISQRQESDPWWPNQSQHQEQCSQQNVVTQEAETGITQQEDESWLKLQELSRTVQQLADEHITLASANREAERQQKVELHDLRTQHTQQQLTIKKLEEDALEHQKLMICLQNKLMKSEQERDKISDNNKQLNLVIKEVQQEHEISQKEKKRLQDQLIIEKTEQQQLIVENKKLVALLNGKKGDTENEIVSEENNVSPEPETDGANSSRRLPEPSPKAAAELERFREQMKTKREARHQALQAISNEMERLRGELNTERAEKCEALQQLEQMKEAGAQNHSQVQLEETLVQLNNKTEECQQLESEKEKYKTQIMALKEVIALSKEMLNVRENQVAQLKQSIREIEGTVVGNNRPITVELKAEYESQMENIKDLKALYEERMKIIEAEKEKFIREQQRLKEELNSEVKQSAELEIRVKELENAIAQRNNTVSDLQDQLSDSLDQSRNLSNELALINNIFTQILVGSDTDLDKLIKVLQENHDLMTEITTNEESDDTAASLPKLLLNLISQVNTSCNGDTDSSIGNEASCTSVPQGAISTSNEIGKANEEAGLNLNAQEIASKLPKVWKVLIELISQQVVPSTSMDNRETCYKSIDTPNGPRLTISVSKTFLRLKDLILEKRSLQKELTNLKQLNGHLESKLMQQERRLSLVSSELRKTWSVVGRMRTQYQQLHTHEKVLRYELQQKRKLLNELKEELEYCREKWVEARKKNSESEVEWRKLRREFSQRKKEVEDSFNNSGESGYSDDRGDDSGDDDTGQRQSPMQGLQPSVNELDNFEDLTVSSSDILSETENTEDSSNSSHNSSLPDLVSASTDSNMPSLLLSNELFPEPIEENTTPTQNDQPTEECPTISLIASLKQQLAQLSQDLEIITSNMDLPENLRAIKSIFSLPAIQIPEHIIHSLHSKPITEINKCRSSEKARKENRSPEKVRHECTVTEPAKGESRSPEEVLDARAARLKRLEEQSQQLFNKITRTTHRSTALSNRLEELHEQYGAARPSNDIPNSSSSSSVQPVQQTPSRSPEEILQGRAARLKRLEEQCQQLFDKVTRTTERSTTLSNQLDELHQQYGPQETASSSSNIPAPPPLPAKLPSQRLPTCQDDSPDAPHEPRQEEEEEEENR